MTDDPILDAKTVAELCAAIDQKYALGLPVSFDAGTVLATLWGFTVAVKAAPAAGVLYEARAASTYPFAQALDATLLVDLLGTPSGG